MIKQGTLVKWGPEVYIAGCTTRTDNLGNTELTRLGEDKICGSAATNTLTPLSSDEARNLLDKNLKSALAITKAIEILVL